MNKYANAYLKTLLSKIPTSAKTVAGGVGAVGAAHYGGGLDWQDSAPWAIAGAGLANKPYRSWMMGKGENFVNEGARNNAVMNRVLGGVAVKGGLPVALAVGRHVPPALEGIKDTAQNLSKVTGDAASGGLGNSIAETGSETARAARNLASTTRMTSDVASNLATSTKSMNPSDPMGIKPVGDAVSRLANIAEGAAKAVDQYKKPLAYGAAAIGGGFVLSKLLDSVAKLRQPKQKDKTKIQ